MEKKICDLLSNPPKKYRPMPFWSWNSKLKTEETLFQVDEMDSVGMGGYFMHARGGLQTTYMGKEWFDNVRAAVNHGTELGMQPWGYDENGWPSGFGSGAVNGLGVKYQQKYIHMDITDEPINNEYTITNIAGKDGKNMHFYYMLNRFYIDAMDPEVTDAFIESTHEMYKKELGEDFKKMAGFFTDEPQLSRKPKGIPWSLTLPAQYEKEYGENLLEHLDDLFITTEKSYKTRYRFWRLVTRLFAENFTKRIYEWCNKNGVSFTGHMVCEETFSNQLDCNGSCMPHYMYMHIPGIDKLQRNVDRFVLAPQIASVCAQAGKKQILTESFALCGWDVSFEELKWILEWQMVRGVNLLCQHLAGYSLGGLRKRDYPAGHFYQNPWWRDYNNFNDMVSRIGMLLAEGEIKCDVLVLHTISSAWIDRCDDHYWQNEVEKNYRQPLTRVMDTLDKNQILFHLGDDTVMETLASVKGNILNIGNMNYKTVIVPESKNISSNTLSLLENFAKAGGNVIFVGKTPEYIDGEKSSRINDISANYAGTPQDVLGFIPSESKFISFKHIDGSEVDVQYISRKFDDFEMYYFVNTYSGKECAIFETNGKSIAKFNYRNGKVEKVPFELSSENKIRTTVELEPKGSVVYFVYDDNRFAPYTETKQSYTSINEKLRGEWQITKSEKNAINLDSCDLYFDGKLIGKDITVTDITEMANELERKVNIRMDFVVNSTFDVPGETFLVLEDADKFTISINGKVIDNKYCGYFRDKSFIKLDVSGHIVKGTNTITLTTDFEQTPETYAIIKDCFEFECMKNKLSYDREIEEIYLLGDFCVESDKEFVPTPNRSFTTAGSFTLVPFKKHINDGDIVKQGFPFFTGKMTLTKSFDLSASELNNRIIEFEKMGAVITSISVNDQHIDDIMYAPYLAMLDGYLRDGENEISIEITSNFRNLLGPLHEGEDSYCVVPASFLRNSKVFHHRWVAGGSWKPEYTFLETGIFLK